MFCLEQPRMQKFMSEETSNEQDFNQPIWVDD